MPRSHVRWQFGAWRKPGHADTPKDARLLYMTILADELLNQGGVVRVALDMWADDAGMTLVEAETALAELHTRRFVVVDGHELLVRTFVRNDGVANQPNVLGNALACLRLVRSPKLRKVAAAELRKLPAALPPRALKSGRMFIYPDPHACAAEIDPDGPDTGLDEPVDNPDPNPSQNPSANPSPRTLPGTLRGGGRGRGISSSSVGGEVGGSRARAREAPGQPSTAAAPPPPLPGLIVGLPTGIPDQPPRCARCSKLPAELDLPCRGCKRLRIQWEADLADRDSTARTARASLSRVTTACRRCDGDGWEFANPANPAAGFHAPARRCAHPPGEVTHAS